MSSGNTSSSRSKVEPDFPYPSCWQDEARVQVLLAPFRERTVNPENYDSKMKFWKNIILEYCQFKGKANFCVQELQQTFTTGQRVPSCLDRVIEDMQRNRQIRLRTDYEYDPANSWTGWIVSSLWKKPLHWSHSRFKNILGSPNLAQMGLVEFVHLKVIEKYCNDLQVTFDQPMYSGTLHHYEALKEKVGTVLNISDDCFRMCLLALSCRNKIGLSYIQDKGNNRIHLVKIPSTTDPNVLITEGDHAIHNLQVTKESLLKQIEELELSIIDNEDKARLYIKENKRLLAKTYLRKKQLLEKNHEKRSLALHNIETLLSNVDDAKHNGVILEAYRYGSKALQDALKSSNLTFDNVDEVVSEVRETMDNCRELQDTLANVKLNEDEDELERELRELLDDNAHTNSHTERDLAQNNNNNSNHERSYTRKVQISDAELLAMLDGLQVEQESPTKNISLSKTHAHDT